MKKVVSFSLWGNLDKYCIGAIKNTLIAQNIYPGWVCRFYVDILVPIGIKIELSEMKNVEIIEMNKVGDYSGMFWRFLPLKEDDIDVLIVRDCDSRLSLRERETVEQWINSDKLMHTIIDHPYHKFHVMPGLTGFKKDIFKLLWSNIGKFKPEDIYGTDYQFFAQNWDLYKEKLLIHDSIFERGVKFPIDRIGLSFIGEVFDEKDNPNNEHREVLRRFLNEN